jgi:hypothetical protein
VADQVKEDRPKRKIPDKCVRCALMDMDQVREKHGSDGDGCWNPKVCYARRSHARHRDRRNTTRNLKSQSGGLREIPVNAPEVNYGVLVVYRPMGADTPVHAIAAEVWCGSEKQAIVPVVHCAGMRAAQVEGYVQNVLNVLEQNYGIKKFASLERREVFECPIRPCPHHSAGRT